MKNTILISGPDSCVDEQLYIYRYIFGDVFGVEYQCEFSESQSSVEVKINNHTIEFAVDIWNMLSENWLRRECVDSLVMCNLPVSKELRKDGIEEESVPILFDNVTSEVLLAEFRPAENRIIINADIFGNMFLHLSRYEEFTHSNRDQFFRYNINDSLLMKFDLYTRPIVNEYINLVWSALLYFSPELTRRKFEFDLQVSCDVDHVYHCGVKNLKMLLERAAADLLLRRSIFSFVKTIVNYPASKLGSYRFDSNLSAIRKMMDINELHNHRAVFNFICTDNHSEYDGCYTLDEPVVEKILIEIDERGHEIGFHPSFETMDNKDLFNSEIKRLRDKLQQLGITQQVKGGRQHYLKASEIETFRFWEDCGLEYDSTLGYPDRLGFRCGICFAFPIYDVVERRQLSLIEKPLVCMEVGVIYGSEAAPAGGRTKYTHELIRECIETVKKHNGSFTFLWHNTEFKTRWDVDVYRSVLSAHSAP